MSDTATDNNRVSDEQIIDVMRTCYDPEIPVNIYDLGLIYDFEQRDNGELYIKMTLTTPNCPSIEELPEELRQRLLALPGIENVTIDLVWDPPFTPDMMSEDAKFALGIL